MSKLKSQIHISKFARLALVAVALTFTICALRLESVSAVTPRMESPLFRIDWGNVNIGAKDLESDGYSLKTTLGQTAAQQFSSNGYVIKAGFQYWHSIIPFRFTISNSNIDLGSLTPSTPSTATTTLGVYFGSAGQYQVTATELGPMSSLSGNTIPDTQCNGGSDTCNESVAKPWTSNSAYGFGYNMTGQDIPSDFSSTSHYRPFPDQVAGETPAVVMSNENVGKNRQATVNFKVNVDATQPAGSYQTVIHFVATPSF